MLRRNARLRREYLYKKNLEGKEATIHERKQKLKEATAAGKKIPTELKREYDSLKASIDLDDDGHADPTNHVDDEYALAGVKDPKVLLTTARDPSTKLAQFAKEMKLLFPNCQRMNRGAHIITEIVETCRSNEFTDIIILHEHRGVPDGMVVSHLPHGPTAYFGLHNCVMRHDIPDRANMSEQFPHIILENLNTQLGKRVGNILKHLFPVPKEENTRVCSFINKDDFISFRHHMYKKEGHKKVQLMEVGPRFEMKLYQIKLGTLDQTEAEDEWVLRPYMNTAKKRKSL